VLPAPVLARFDFLETRNAASILQASNPGEFSEVVEVLKDFELLDSDIKKPGGNKSALAARVDRAFRDRGWREGQHRLVRRSTLRLMGWSAAGERGSLDTDTETESEGYRIDNLKGRLAVDVEWNAKDGNLDRDLGAYRAFYDEELIDGAVIITRSTDDLRRLAASLGVPKKFGTTTTTNIEKLRDRLLRGSAGGCPVLAVAITARCRAVGTV
jgi:hypothetical protein